MLGIALILALGASAAEAPQECRERFKPEYAERWELSQAAWEAGCAQGRDSAELLRSGQAAFLRACAGVFAAPLAQKRTIRSTVDALCAQGAAGRSRLIEELGLELIPPPRPAPADPAPAPAAEAEAGGNGMGPITKAIAAAKERWGEQTCLSAIVYHWGPKRLNKEMRVTDGGVSSSKLLPYEDHVEGYHYYFYEPSRWRDSLTVRYYDKIDHAFNILQERLFGPELEHGAKSTGSDCLEEVDVDAARALKLAVKAGVGAGEESGVRAYLLSPGSWEEAYGQCERGLRKGYTFWCSRSLPARQKKLAHRKELWVVSAMAKTAFIDAAKGELLFVAGSEFQPIRFSDPTGGAAGLFGESK